MSTAAVEIVDQQPYSVHRARVGAVQRLSPSFARITFVGDALAGFGNPGATFDQRVKIIFPPVSGVLPPVVGGADWYRSWLAVPEEERGAMRTYSIRDIRIDDDGATAVDVDFVLHLVPGQTGPASTWASETTPGDEVLIVGPRRGRLDGGGIEYLPGGAGQVLLAGDETAAPAIARILADAPDDLCGAAYIEVPEAADAQPIDAPDGVAVHWLPRDGVAPGEKLHPAVLGHLGEAPGDVEPVAEPRTGEELLWETPRFSRLGEQLDSAGAPVDERYFWIAGESRVVTGLRRRLVKDLGIPRAQVAFMGYWREGVAMKG
ncbi:siderophore-interacting protein [Gordonia phthalatica]|uniref:Siderophore-interacting protein n=1 Tax=Gordonia phthalatica TaxID=1136941 RepID=A0A0N9NG10_9ACTN|nr:siderophore-interacting protein [Gordonia phthalatica]ALG86608.1 siderophore-interacting protein [Gordonia phthalatica]